MFSAAFGDILEEKMFARPQLAACVFACLGMAGLAAAAGTSDANYETSVRPFLDKNCALCHNEKLNTAGVDFTHIKTSTDAEAANDIWERAVEKLRNGSMPPKGIPRPKQEDINSVISWMDAAIQRAEDRAKPDPGRVTARRLNRTEYNNTVRDLLAVDIRPANDFPQDDSGYGFDNIGDVLSVSPVLMERYMTASERLVHRALYGPEKVKPTVIRIQPSSPKFPLLDKADAEYDETGLTMPQALHAVKFIQDEGDYKIRIALEGRRPAGSDPVHIGVWLDGKLVQTLEFDGPTDKNSIDLFGAQRECSIHLTPGDHWLAASVLRIYEGLPVSYGGPNPSKRAVIIPVAATVPSAKKPDHIPANRVYVHFVEVIGPYKQVLGPSAVSRNLIFICKHTDQHKASCPKLILTHFATRAFRRPVTQAEVQPYLDLYAQSRKEGATFDDAIGAALEAILVSPDFLFRIESTASKPELKNASFEAPTGAEAIDDYALASRLSYFLWSTMPDEQLLRVAAAGKLHKPAELRAKLNRMLADPRSQALADNFAGQWLELRKLESTHPDHQKFPEFDNYLRMSMREETERFFEDIVRNNRSILDFLTSKQTFVNQKLAEYYGIPGVKGTEFRKIDLTGFPRQGVLTQASILTVSSYATRTSPVIRGKWVLENMLNATIPPPPPNVPMLDEEKGALDKTMRMQMEEHRKNPMCAACHQKMDPIGFAFENYNAIGQWRDKDGKYPVDASGQLPNGPSFVGAIQLEDTFVKNPQKFAECVTDKLMTYALGRGLERYDRPAVKAIVQATAPDYKFQDLIYAIVTSMPFEMRHIVPPAPQQQAQLKEGL